MRFGQLFLSYLLVVLLAGCGSSGSGTSKVSQDNFNKIDNGMAISEVESLLGKPTGNFSANVGSAVRAESTWENGNRKITITFGNGKVISKKAENL